MRRAASWLQLVASGEPAALLEAVFEAAGAQVITVEGDADEVLVETAPHAMPDWQSATITALFAAGTDANAIGERLEAAFGHRQLRWRAELVEDRDWVRAWMDSYGPMRFGRRLWVCPRHAEVTAEQATVLYLDPGLAFGTGTHATTALCLEWLDGHAPRGLTVLDYGCGSGVLALAAARLGAAAVQAVDSDPQALTASADNAHDNDVGARLRVGAPATAESAALVLANILAAPLITLAPRLIALVEPGGQLILSGILSAQADAVRRAYEPAIRFTGQAERDGWVRLDGIREKDARRRGV